jgi:hypothetical protein
MSALRSLSGPLAALAATAVVVVVTYRVMVASDTATPILAWVAVPAALFVIAFALPLQYRPITRLYPIFMFFGIVIGVIVDAVYDGIANSIDRTLLGVEAIVWLGVAAMPIVVGYLLARWLSRTRGGP